MISIHEQSYHLAESSEDFDEAIARTGLFDTLTLVRLKRSEEAFASGEYRTVLKT
jgi:hypothetical protein